MRSWLVVGACVRDKQISARKRERETCTQRGTKRDKKGVHCLAGCGARHRAWTTHAPNSVSDSHSGRSNGSNNKDDVGTEKTRLHQRLPLSSTKPRTHVQKPNTRHNRAPPPGGGKKSAKNHPHLLRDGSHDTAAPDRPLHARTVERHESERAARDPRRRREAVLSRLDDLRSVRDA